MGLSEPAWILGNHTFGVHVKKKIALFVIPEKSLKMSWKKMPTSQGA